MGPWAIFRESATRIDRGDRRLKSPIVSFIGLARGIKVTHSSRVSLAMAKDPSAPVEPSSGDGPASRLSSRMFHAVYDLSVSPTSYDFLTFLALADLARARAGCPAMQVVFVPDNGSGFWDREPTSEDGKAWRLHNLLIPALQLYPAVAGYAVAASRAEARRLVSRLPAPLFPEGYAVDRPVEDAYQWAHTVAAFLNGQPPASWRPPAAARRPSRPPVRCDRSG